MPGPEPDAHAPLDPGDEEDYADAFVAVCAHEADGLLGAIRVQGFSADEPLAGKGRGDDEFDLDIQGVDGVHDALDCVDPLWDVGGELVHVPAHS